MSPIARASLGVRHTGSKLPVVITYTGRALADPTNDELGAAF